MSRRAGDAGPVGGAAGLTGSGPGLRSGFRPRFQSHKSTAVRRSKRSERGSHRQKFPSGNAGWRSYSNHFNRNFSFDESNTIDRLLSLTTMPKGSHTIETFRD